MLATYANLNTAGNAQHTGQIQAKLIIIAFLITQQQGCSGLFKLSQFYQQLRRRRVLSTILPYLVIVWLALQVVAVVSQLLQLPPLVGNIVAISLFAALPLLLYLAWFYQAVEPGWSMGGGHNGCAARGICLVRRIRLVVAAFFCLFMQS